MILFSIIIIPRNIYSAVYGFPLKFQCLTSCPQKKVGWCLHSKKLKWSPMQENEIRQLIYYNRTLVSHFTFIKEL